MNAQKFTGPVILALLAWVAAAAYAMPTNMASTSGTGADTTHVADKPGGRQAPMTTGSLPDLTHLPALENNAAGFRFGAESAGLHSQYGDLVPGTAIAADRDTSFGNLSGFKSIGWSPIERGNQVHRAALQMNADDMHGHPASRFALISLERSDIDGNNSALIFAILSVYSAMLCLRKKSSAHAEQHELALFR